MAGAWWCWFAGHNWIAAIAPEYLQCERCPKLRRTPPPPHPRGTRTCPYPTCTGWVSLPKDTFRDSNGTQMVCVGKEESCLHCNGLIRWRRRGEGDPWPDAIAIARYSVS